MTGGSEVGVKSWIWTSTQIGVRLVPGPGGQTLGILYKALDFVKVEPSVLLLKALEHLGGPIFTVVPFFFLFPHFLERPKQRRTIKNANSYK